MATAKNAKTNTTTNNEVSELLKQVKELTEILNKRDQAATPPTIVTAGKKGTHNVSAYTMWAKHWREEHPKQNPPAGLWEQECKADSTLKAFYQEQADALNQAEGRVSTKGSTRAPNGKVSGYNLMQKRLGELNARLPEGTAKVACSDEGFKACKVLGADKKVQAEPSIAKLEEWFQEEYGVEIQ